MDAEDREVDPEAAAGLEVASGYAAAELGVGVAAAEVEASGVAAVAVASEVVVAAAASEVANRGCDATFWIGKCRPLFRDLLHAVYILCYFFQKGVSFVRRKKSCFEIQ